MQFDCLNRTRTG